MKAQKVKEEVNRKEELKNKILGKKYLSMEVGLNRTYLKSFLILVSLTLLSLLSSDSTHIITHIITHIDMNARRHFYLDNARISVASFSLGR